VPLVFSTANITNRMGAENLIEMNKERLDMVTNVMADGGYTGDNFKVSVLKSIGASVEIVKRSELHTFKVIPMRWVVERS